ncbi:MAG: PASTA domain-containing protein [Bacteroidaceae bacterium]|nr:PASTA domain-containing protein [Bacteroidaceae bacterium]
MRQYFKGKTGCLFWLNVMLAFAILTAVPIVVYFTIDGYTHHGEKVEVPMVTGLSDARAMELMEKAGLVAEVSDSVFDKKRNPGEVLDQNPQPGTVVKSGHLIHLTINLHGAPMVKLPDLAGNSSRRQAEVVLKDLGFKLSNPVMVYGTPRDLVIAIKQGGHTLRAGEQVNKERVITLVCGAGDKDEDIRDTLDADELDDDMGYTPDTTVYERNVFDKVL